VAQDGVIICHPVFVFSLMGDVQNNKPDVCFLKPVIFYFPKHFAISVAPLSLRLLIKSD
jgi:hypothetical protein